MTTTQPGMIGLLAAWAWASSAVALGAPLPTDWPQWRGPTRDGLAPGPAWPSSLDTNALRQVWRVELEPSYSGPIVGGDRVFVTDTNPEELEILGSRKVAEAETWAHLAISGDLLFFRELKALAAWRWAGAGAQAAEALSFEL